MVATTRSQEEVEKFCQKLSESKLRAAFCQAINPASIQLEIWVPDMRTWPLHCWPFWDGDSWWSTAWGDMRFRAEICSVFFRDRLGMDHSPLGPSATLVWKPESLGLDPYQNGRNKRSFLLRTLVCSYHLLYPNIPCERWCFYHTAWQLLGSFETRWFFSLINHGHCAKNSAMPKCYSKFM